MIDRVASRRNTALWLILLLAACAAPPEPVKEIKPQAAPAPPPPPARNFIPPTAPERTVIDDYHGTAVVDPYRYFENLKSPEVSAFMKAQADYARDLLERIPGRAALLKRVNELSESGVTIGAVQIASGKVFYFKPAAGDVRRKVYVRDGFGGKERVLIDPLTGGPAELSLSIDYFRASPNGRYVAYGVSARGNEESVLRVIDVEKGSDLGIVIEGARFGQAVAWDPDSRSFFYNRLPAPESGAVPIGYLNSRVYRHVLGSDSARDQALFGRGVNDQITDLADIDIPRIVVPAASNTALAIVEHGDQRELSIYAAPASTLMGSGTPWKKILDRSDEVTDFAAHGMDLYLVTHRDAPRGKVVKTSLFRPDMARATTVVAESDQVTSEIAIAADALYIKQLNAGNDILQRLNVSTRVFSAGKLEYVRLPFDLAVRAMITDPNRPGAVLRLESWNQPPAYMAVEERSARIVDTGLLAKSPVDFSSYDELRLFATAKDGTRIPISMVYRKGLLLSHNHPTLLTGYGAYGTPQSPTFQASRLAWLERDAVFATCHVRGGGEYGEPWHRMGQLANKTKSIDDFIACAEFLIARGFTNAKHLAAMGTRAGGIIIGNALLRRPDLFAAVVVRVGALDMLRMENTANGKPNVVEFGSTRTPQGFKWLYEASAYHQIKDKTAYPAVLLTTGANDSRVEPWNSLKFAARLQNASTNDKPILLRVDYGAEHATAMAESRYEELTDVYAFLFWQLNTPGFRMERN